MISHSILISRLSALGIHGTALSWFTSYLSDRQHYIAVHQAKSSTAPVSHGVPQGSVLGPLLFIIDIRGAHMCLDEWNSWERAPYSAETINI